MQNVTETFDLASDVAGEKYTEICKKRSLLTRCQLTQRRCPASLARCHALDGLLCLKEYINFVLNYHTFFRLFLFQPSGHQLTAFSQATSGIPPVASMQVL